MNVKQPLATFFSRSKLPIILQAESSECGLACLAMILGFHGYDVSMREIRTRSDSAARGVNLQSLINISQQFGLYAKPIRLSLDQLKNLQMPCILHWDFNHFVVLESVALDRVIIHDPAIGRRQFTYGQVSECFTGIALELGKGHEFQIRKDSKKLKLKDLWGESTEITKPIIRILLISVLLQSLYLVSPLYVKSVLDSVTTSGGEDYISILTIVFTCVGLIIVSTEILRSITIIYFGSQLSLKMSVNLMNHLLALPVRFFEQRHIGDIISRFSSLEPIRGIVTESLVRTIVDGVMVITTLVMMIYFSPLLAAVVMSFLTVYISIRWALFSKFREYAQESIVASAIESTNFIESIRVVRTLKLFNQEQNRVNLWENLYRRELNSNINVRNLSSVFDASKIGVISLANIAVIYIGAQFVINSTMTIGTLMAFIAYKAQFMSRFLSIIEEVIGFRMLSVHLDRISDIVFEDQELLGNKNSATKFPEAHSPMTVQISEASFKYGKTEDRILSNTSVIFSAGESHAITGTSGVGKTTLLKILLGFLPLESGVIRVDGKSLTEFGLANFRCQIGAVMQDDRLLAGSILENICFFEDSPDMKWVQECTKIACIHGDIMAMPMGYETRVEDSGASLSGGQVQRLLIARALYRKPRALFLDEATSSLDADTENEVANAIANLNITRIIIAHRKETINSADNVYIVENQNVIPKIRADK